MVINEFIKAFREKRILPNVSLPKYRNLLKEKEKEEQEKLSSESENKIVSGSFINTINGISLFENKMQGSLQLPSHILDTLQKDFTNIMEYISGNLPASEFNELISNYLVKESGYDATFNVKASSGRPGSGNNFIAISPEDYEPDTNMINYISVQDQVTLCGGLRQEKADQIRPSFLDRLLSVFSKKHFDKVFTETTKSLYRNTDGFSEQDKKRENTRKISLTIEDFFAQVKLKSSEAEKFKNHISAILRQVECAKDMGQTALIEKLTSKLVTEVYEGALMSAGYTKYITLDDLKQLSSKSPKGISIDYPQNFTRVIPEEVIEKKTFADQLCIFDQYVILHFDPEKKNTKDTTKEVEEKKSKDPILFGVILDSPKLYFIADWVDELCDLTWDKALEILGEKEENRVLKFQEKKN